MSFIRSLPCQWTECGRMAEGWPIYCYGCERVLCRQHLDTLAHRCRTLTPKSDIWDRPFEEALFDLDYRALCTELTRLRPGHHYRLFVPPLQSDEVPEDCHGAMNVHVQIRFEDGEQWMLRVRAYHEDHPPIGLMKMVRESEFTTMNVLSGLSNLVPKAYAWGTTILSRWEDPQCIYMFTQRMHGNYCYPIFSYIKPTPAIIALRRSFVESYADFSIQLATRSFEAMGSLIPDPTSGKPIVGPLIDYRNANSINPPYFGGPFKTLRERYIYHIDNVIEGLKKGLICRRAPVLTYLAHLVAREMVMGCPELAEECTEFYLRQPDARADQFLIEKGKISAVLDWEFATTTTKAHAFAAPEAMYRTPAWHCGDNTLTESEKYLCEIYEQRNRHDLAQCVKNGRLYQRLENFIGNENALASTAPIAAPYLIGFLNGMIKAFLGDNAADDFDTTSDWVSWAMERHRDDPFLPMVRKLEGKADMYGFDYEHTARWWEGQKQYGFSPPR